MQSGSLAPTPPLRRFEHFFSTLSPILWCMRSCREKSAWQVRQAQYQPRVRRRSSRSFPTFKLVLRKASVCFLPSQHSVNAWSLKGATRTMDITSRKELASVQSARTAHEQCVRLGSKGLSPRAMARSVPRPIRKNGKSSRVDIQLRIYAVPGHRPGEHGPREIYGRGSGLLSLSLHS